MFLYLQNPFDGNQPKSHPCAYPGPPRKRKVGRHPQWDPGACKAFPDLELWFCATAEESHNVTHKDVPCGVQLTGEGQCRLCLQVTIVLKAFHERPN